MKNVKPRCTTAKEYKKTFVEGYSTLLKGGEDYIKVKLEGKKPWTLKATNGNVTKVEDALENQTKYQVKEVLPALRTDFKAESALAIIGTLFAIGTKVIEIPQLSEQANSFLHYAAGVLSAAGISLGANTISKIRNILKWDYYFKEQYTLQEGIGESYSMLTGTSAKARKAIASTGDERLINPKNLEKIPFGDLKKIDGNILAQKDMQFSFDNPIEKRLL